MYWAAYLAVILTGFLVPFELYELLDWITVSRMSFLLVNVAIVAYLIEQLQRDHTFTPSPVRSVTGLWRSHHSRNTLP